MTTRFPFGRDLIRMVAPAGEPDPRGRQQTPPDLPALLRKAAQHGVDLMRGRWPAIRRARRLTRSTLSMSREQLENWVGAQLRALLLEVGVSVPYYRDLLRDRRREEPHALLRTLPVLTKAIVRQEFERLISQQIPRRRLLFSSTGGSTGEPMPYGRDRDRQWLAQVDQELASAWAGMVPGGRVLWIWGSPFDVARHTDAWRRIWNHTIHGVDYLPAFAMPADVRPWVHEFDRLRPDVVIGYTGALVRFARLCSEAETGPSWTPRGIVASAETLDAASRSEVENVLRASVFDRYASRELGIVAQECEHRHGLHVFEHGKLVELLDSRNTPVSPGELGRIVVTDLWNVGFPLIRYDTGDLARWAEQPCTCGRSYVCLAEIAGRVTDFLVGADGTAVSGISMPHLLKDFPGIEKFQAIQDRTGRVLVQVVTAQGLGERDRLQIVEILKRLVRGVPISVEEVPNIVIPPSGKHRPVISERSRALHAPPG